MNTLNATATATLESLRSQQDWTRRRARAARQELGKVLQPEERRQVRASLETWRTRDEDLGQEMARIMAASTSYQSTPIVAADLQNGMVILLGGELWTISQVRFGTRVSFHGVRERKGPGSRRDFSYFHGDPVVRILGHYIGR